MTDSPPFSSASSNSSSSAHAALRNGPVDPITRTALRYTISPREYELLHQYIISRAPATVQKRTPDPARYARITTGRKHHKAGNGEENGSSGAREGGNGDVESNVAAMRAALRVFVVMYFGMKTFETVTRRLAQRRGDTVSKTQPVRFGNARVALSFSGILLFHRLIHRFLRRLRGLLLDDNATPFRKRNPRTTRLLTARCTPAVGAALSGLFLGVTPAGQMRITMAIYVFTRSLEFAYNALEDTGKIWKARPDGSASRPWWFGSWMLMPFACGQLLHAFVFDRDCFPEDYGSFILKRSPEYIQTRPRDYNGRQPWPRTFDIVDALAELSKLHWPPFVSPVLFPADKQPLPATLTHISPITASANPAITHTSCALLHPHDPSCGRTFVRYFIRAFPSVARFFALIYGAFALLAYKSLMKNPVPFLNRLSSRILRMALFITGAIGTSWASICFSNIYLPRNFLPTQRWFLGGFAGGLWAFLARSQERGNFLYSARLSIDSTYKVGKKRGWWRGVKNGDVMVFVASLALLEYVYETHPVAIHGGALRKAISLARGEGWKDRVVVAPAVSESNEEAIDEVVKEKVERREEQEDALGQGLFKKNDG